MRTMAKLRTISDIDENLLETLKSHGIGDSASLLAKARNRRDRIRLSTEAGISYEALEKLFHLANLMRIEGVDDRYAALLEISGTQTTEELSHRNPENLRTWMITVNRVKRIVQEVPEVETLARWIARARELEESAEG